MASPIIYFNIYLVPTLIAKRLLSTVLKGTAVSPHKCVSAAGTVSGVVNSVVDSASRAVVLVVNNVPDAQTLSAD